MKRRRSGSSQHNLEIGAEADARGKASCETGALPSVLRPFGADRNSIDARHDHPSERKRPDQSIRPG